MSHHRPGGARDLIITCIKGEGKLLKFWALSNHGLETVKSFENRLRILQEDLDASAGFSLSEQIPIGFKCVVKSKLKPGRWCRAGVLAHQGYHAILVRLLDYGNDEVVLVSDVRNIDDPIMSVQPQAIECILADVMPVHNEWTSEAIKFCEQHLLCNTLSCYVVSEFLKLPVVRVAKKGETEAFVQRLINGGLALIKRETVSPPTVQLSYKMNAIEPNSKHLVRISCFENAQKFYVQLSPVEMELKHMMDSINRLPKDSFNPLKVPAVNTPCLAQLSTNKPIYYRALITYIQQNHCKVFFVDYGFSEQKDIHELRAIPPTFLSLAAQAICCSLPREASIDPEEFQRLVGFEHLELFVISRTSESYIVKLFFHGQDLLMPAPPAAQNYIPQKLNINAKCDVTVSYVNDLSEFYCQLTNMKEQQNIISNILNTGYNFLPISLNECIPGKPVCAKFSEDNLWYRAKIVKVNHESDIEVFFVDFGNYDNINLSDVRKIGPDLLKFPIQSFKCFLYNTPIPTDSKVQDDAFDLLEQLTSGQNLLAHVNTFSEDAGYGITLFVRNSPLTVNEKILSLFMSLPVVPVNDVEDVYVTSFDSCKSFFVQFEKIDSEKLANMQEEINSFYSGIQNNMFVPKEGDLVCARFHEDEQYYRARVEKCKDGECDVFFIDYGNRESIPLRDVHPIDAKFTQYPQFGTECAFENFASRISSDKLTEIMLENSYKLNMIRKESEKWYVSPVENFPGNAALLNLVKQLEGSSGSSRHDDKFSRHQESFSSQPARSNSWNDNTHTASHHANKNEMVNNYHSEPPKREPFKSPEPVQEFKDYSLISIPPKACRNIYVSHIVSPGEFYCQIEEDSTKLQLLMKNIEDIYAVETDDLNLSNFAVDVPCCAVYEDGVWYRGKIKKVGVDTCDIFFVDYGNTDSIPKSKIKKIRNDLFRWPSQCVCCKAFNISPKSGDWNDKEINAFIDKALDKSFIAQFVECDSNNCYAVNLFSIDQLGNNIFNKEFVNLGYGRLQDTNTSIIMNPRSASTNLSFSAVDIEINSSEAVQVFYGLNPGEIFCQLKSYEQEFKQMMIKMQNYYKNVTEAESLIDRPHQGMICAAQFSLDSAWYRAEVKKVETNKLIVFYVDYGNSEKVDRKKVRCIIQEYTILPVQAIKCRIRGIKPPGKSWTINNNLGKYFEGNAVCKFIAKEEDAYLVDITCNQKDVAQLLISDGLAASDGSIIQTLEPKRVQAETPKFNEKLSPGLDVSRISQKVAERNDGFTQGQLISVTISFIENPLKFWCQLLDESDILNELVEKIENTVTEYPPLTPSSLKIGSYCMAQYSEDEAWYRAQIISCESEDTCKVFFIDYGNSEDVSLSQMKIMTPDLIQQPPFCFECRLYNAPSKLLPEMTTLFSDTVDGVEEITAKIESVHSNICTVTLLFDKDDQEMNVNELLFGVKENADEHGNICYESPRFLPPDVPLGLHEGYVSVVKSPQDFYIQLSGTEDPLADLSEELAELSESSADVNPVNLSPGYACSTKYSEDNNWYRAEVIDLQDSTVSVLFVDYGNIEIVEKSTLKCLSDKHLQMPCQAIKCKLNGIVPVAEEWTEEAINTFQDMVLDACLGITFICKDIPAMVNITKDDKEVAQCLVDMELANFESCTETDEAYAEDHLAPAPIEDPLSSLPNDQSYPERKLSSLKHIVKMCYVDTYDKFYVTPLELGTELDTVSATLEILYESPDSTEGEDRKPTITDVLEDPKISMPCVAKYSADDKWYRAIITDIEEENIFVTFIDYGNSEIMNLTNLRPIPPELLKIPPIALQCSLFGIVAKPGKEQEIADKLDKYFVDDIDLEMEIIEFSPYKIKLFLNGDDIASSLIKEELAEEHYVIPGESETFADSSKMTFVDGSLEYRIQISKRFFSGADKIIGNVKFCEIENDLIVFHVVSTDLEDDLQDLQQKLQDAYCKPSQNLANVSCMDFCATKYMEDENWYRAQVLSIEKDKIKVRFIDYGNCETVDKSDIYELLGDFTIEPQFSVKCILFGLKVDKSKEVELQNQLDEYVYHEPVELKLCKHSHAVCDLCITSVICGNTDITELVSDEKLVHPQYIINSQLDAVFRATVQKIEADIVFLLPLSVIDEREAFQCKLQNVCKDLEKLTKPQVDHLCAAKVDDVWFRVSVMNISESEVTVDLVDFGFIKVTEISEFVPLPLDICHQPIFLQPCVVHVTEDSTGNAKTINIEDLSIGSEVSCELKKIYPSVQPLSVKIIEIHSSLKNTEIKNESEVHTENDATMSDSEAFTTDMVSQVEPFVNSEKEYFSQNEKETEKEVDRIDIENDTTISYSESLANDNKTSEVDLCADSEKEIYFSENENEAENDELDQVNTENDISINDLQPFKNDIKVSANEPIVDAAKEEYFSENENEAENDELDQVSTENDTAINDLQHFKNDIKVSANEPIVDAAKEEYFSENENEAENKEFDKVNIENDSESLISDVKLSAVECDVNSKMELCISDNIREDESFKLESDKTEEKVNEEIPVKDTNAEELYETISDGNKTNKETSEAGEYETSLEKEDTIAISEGHESFEENKHEITEIERYEDENNEDVYNESNKEASFYSTEDGAGLFNESSDVLYETVTDNNAIEIDTKSCEDENDDVNNELNKECSFYSTEDGAGLLDKSSDILCEAVTDNNTIEIDTKSCEDENDDVNNESNKESSFYSTEDRAGLLDKNSDILCEAITDNNAIEIDSEMLHEFECAKSSVAIENEGNSSFGNDELDVKDYSADESNVFEDTDISPQNISSTDSTKQQSQIEVKILDSAAHITSDDCNHSLENSSSELSNSMKEKTLTDKECDLAKFDSESDMECSNLLNSSKTSSEHFKETVPLEDTYNESEDKTSENDSMLDQNKSSCELIADNQNSADDEVNSELKLDEQETSNLSYCCDGNDKDIDEGNVINSFEDAELKENNRIIEDSFPLTGLVPVRVSHIAISDGSVIFAVQPLYLQEEFLHLKKSIQEFYSSKAVPYNASFDSQFCVVFHEGEWCRGKILQSGDSTILLIDYGKCTSVDSSNIKKLDDEHSNVPPFAVWCTLSSATCPPEKKETVKTFLYDKLKDTDAVVKILEGSEPYKINMFIKGESILNQLLKNSLVIQKLPNMYLEPGSYKAKLSSLNIILGTVEIFVNLLSFSDEYNALFDDMQSAYKVEDYVSNIVKSGIYAIFYNDSWYRCLVVSSSNEVQVFLVDTGETVTGCKNLCFLLPEHCLQSAFAIPCHIPLSDIQATNEIFESINGILKAAEFLVHIKLCSETNSPSATLIDEQIMSEVKNIGLTTSVLADLESVEVKTKDNVDIDISVSNDTNVSCSNSSPIASDVQKHDISISVDTKSSSTDSSTSVNDVQKQEQFVGYLEETFTADL